ACDGAEVTAGGGADLPTTEPSPPYAEWALDSAPSVRIGAEGAPEYQFSGIGHAARLSDGRLVVYDGASAELRWFDPEGAFLFRAGGRGEGPGEFLNVASATVTPHDSVVLYDFRNQRLTWFGPQGSLSRTLRLELHPMAVALVPFGDGRLVISDERSAYTIGGDEYNYARDSVLVLVAHGNTEAVDTLMHRAGREAATWVEYTDGQPMWVPVFLRRLFRIFCAGGRRTVLSLFRDCPPGIGVDACGSWSRVGGCGVRVRGPGRGWPRRGRDHGARVPRRQAVCWS